jgi:LysM repeat protein
VLSSSRRSAARHFALAALPSLLLSAGCSQTATTQERPSWSLTSSGTKTVAEAPAGDYEAQLAASTERAQAESSYTRESLPPPTPYRYAAQPSGLAPVARLPDRSHTASIPQVATPGQSIVVAPGDTLYAISRRHGVPVDALMAANGLADGAIKSGQSLVIPPR